MEITDADRERILQIIAERLNNYTALWKSPEFAALEDSNWSANREAILRPVTSFTFGWVVIPSISCSNWLGTLEFLG
jgi:hypothetical protein